MLWGAAEEKRSCGEEAGASPRLAGGLAGGQTASRTPSRRRRSERVRCRSLQAFKDLLANPTVPEEQKKALVGAGIWHLAGGGAGLAV